jgi:hypothetical protein
MPPPPQMTSGDTQYWSNVPKNQLIRQSHSLESYVAEQRHISDLNPHISPSHWYDSRGQLSIVEHSSRPLIVTHFGSVWLPCAKFKITVGNSPDPKGGTGSPSDDEADPAVEVALLAMVKAF